MHYVSMAGSTRGQGLTGETTDSPRNGFGPGQFWVARRDVHSVEPAAYGHPQVQALIGTRHDGASAPAAGADTAAALQALWQRGARLLVLRDREERVLACGAVALDSGEIGGLFVAPDQRRCGLGERLLRGLEADAARARCRRVWLRAGTGQQAALRLFERQRYHRCGESGGPGRACVLLAKAL